MWRFTALELDLEADGDRRRPQQSCHPSKPPLPLPPPISIAFRLDSAVATIATTTVTGVFLTFFLIICLAAAPVYGDGRIPGVEIFMPSTHTALSGDLHIQILSSSFPPLLLQLSRLEGDTIQALTTFPVLPEARALAMNTTIVTVPCGYFSKGGQYYVLFKKQGLQAPAYNYGNGSTTTIASTTTEEEEELRHTDDEIITRALDVRWPMPQLSLTPEYVQTYPLRPVMAILQFPGVECKPVADSPPSAIPEFWLELHYCGHSLLTCDDNNNFGDNRTANQNSQVLYSEQVRGFPGKHVLTLRCELFGLAGHYSLILRPTTPTPTISHTAAYVKADWSDQFVFNVHARSIFPCETHTGVPVLFQYPSCILSSGDKVRLYARLRDNVASLAPPTSLEYVSEQRVTRGQHSLYFDCDLFTERYVEYCFVYVSQAITGAVADVRMDCVPTLPVTESESGGWGVWSPWTPCSSTCIGGTRNRYRFCDSPPPRYGAKFCEGPSVETEKCGTGIGSSWECFYTNGISANDIAAEIPEVQAEVGPYCRCGCVVHLGHAKPRRLLATSSQSCPGRTFWLIQSDDDFIIQFRVEQFHLPCGTQWLKVRDGRALYSTLLVDLSGEPETTPAVVNSTGPNILLEFFSDEVSTSTQFCGGGFLAHAEQLRPPRNITMVAPVAQGIGLPISALKLTAVHIAAIFFLSGLLIATTLLGAQYAFRYRKYHIAQAEDQDSFADFSASSASLPLTGVHRASSNVTLLSEVISLTRLRPNISKSRNKHSRLRESVDCKELEEQEVTLAEEETLSASSTMTLTHPEDSIATVQQTTSFSDVPNDEETTCSLPNSPQSYDEGTLRRSSTIISSEKDRSTEKESCEERWKIDPEVCRRRLSHASTITLTNGSYSPAASIISRATIRSTNPKESKEKRNRERLLAGSGSDFSLCVGDGDLEMDYYDYNVVNAGAAPGSYLGMDPAFLVWIPPLEEGEMILEENEEVQRYVDPGSNKESPEEETELLPKRVRSLSDANTKCSPLMSKKYKKVHPLVIVDNKISCESLNRHVAEQEHVGHSKVVSIQMHDFPAKIILGSPVRVHKEKETMLEKSNKIKENFDEIRFADEEDDEVAEILQNRDRGAGVGVEFKRTHANEECNTNLSYHDSNVLSTTTS